jgi:crotonobetaine/carnitine-CoA ligase
MTASINSMTPNCGDDEVPSAPAYLVQLLGKTRATTSEVWAARAAATPEQRFLLAEDGRAWSFKEGLTEIKKFASHLREFAWKSGRVASYLNNPPEAIWSWFGTNWAGGVYVALNRHHKGELLNDMLSRCRADVLVTDSAGITEIDFRRCRDVRSVIVVESAAPTLRKEHGLPPDVRWINYSTITSAHSGAELPAAPSGPADTAGILFTSGTTGRSKAVRIPHNMYCRGGARIAEAARMTPDDTYHAWMPLYHIAGQLYIVMTCLLAGASIAQFSTFSRSKWWAQVRDVKATICNALPNVLQLLYDQPATAGDLDNSVRVCFSAYVPPHLFSLPDRFGFEFLDIYGMTEGEPMSLPMLSLPVPAGSCGRASPDFEVAIVDEQDLPVPCGKDGEIIVRPRVPDVMMLGYEDDEAATLSACRNLWFHTGDIAYRDANGFIFFVDRKKHRIRRRGENVSAWEVEKIVASHPAVESCIAFGVPSPLGEEDVKILVSVKYGSQLIPVDLHEYCVREMARFMVPRYIEVVPSLPHTGVGKVDRQAARQMQGDLWDAEAEGNSTSQLR